MSEKKVRDKREVAKEALKREYLEEIAKELRAKGNIINEEDLRVDDKGKTLIFDRMIFGLNNDALIGFVKYLAERLADTEAELWFQKEFIKIQSTQ